MTEIGERGQPESQELPTLTEELARVMEASRRIEHLDSAKDYVDRYEADSAKLSPASSTATTAPPVSPCRPPHTASLQKHLWFSGACTARQQAGGGYCCGALPRCWLQLANARVSMPWRGGEASGLAAASARAMGAPIGWESATAVCAAVLSAAAQPTPGAARPSCCHPFLDCTPSWGTLCRPWPRGRVPSESGRAQLGKRPAVGGAAGKPGGGSKASAT